MYLVAVIVPRTTPISYQMRPSDTMGRLLIMRSPDSSLYSYIQLKLNAYIAYHNATSGGKHPFY